ncbi:uncharacterized protein LOC117323419 isoform X1 [Pecten maximus]|uniref:uncharacterized protein LOC117323419 isoform X1 n=1 Tax=Pecten maximus TaxID=6579 RepID=UPI001458D4D4|nr:uncharacterized protein LOC117323419 isoform X1 [Pecten maximus]
MMRGMHSNSTELPLTRNMPFSSKSVPTRHQPRNMTGIYLGLEGNIKPPQQKFSGVIPPLARGRGMTRIRTPTEHRRYRKVEQLRIKEEKRGFVGQPLKRKNTVISPDFPEPFHQQPSQTQSLTSPRAKQWGPAKHADRTEFFDLIRTNPRNYTVVVNNGVTRSENLSGLMSFAVNGDETKVAWPEMLADEVHRISTRDDEDVTGLEECFKKVCKGNVESIYSLLPYRKQNQREQYSTGFQVRSYRNPNRAEIMADFNNMSRRPRTVPANRPMVPSPYFFKYYNGPYNKGKEADREKPSTASQFENQFSTLNGTSKIIAAPGAGLLSRSLKSRSAAWSEGDLKLHTKLHTHPAGTPSEHIDDDTDIRDTYLSGRQVQRSMTVNSAEQPIIPEGQSAEVKDTKGEGSEKPETTKEEVSSHLPEDSEENKQEIISASIRTTERDSTEPSSGADGTQQGEINTTSENVANMDTIDNSNLSAEQKAANRKGDEFVFGVADEHGKQGEVEIDTADQEDAEQAALKGNVRKASISEKVEKSRVSQAYIESIKENAEQRKKDLEKMLDEHAELVQEISRVASSDNISAEDRDQ